MAAAPRKPRGRVVGGCGTCHPCEAGVGRSLTSAAPALSPSAAASVHLHPSWRRRVVPLKGRYRPQNCPRWCPLRLKWSRNPKRPPLGPLMGDLCFATQVWDLSPFQRWGKVGKVGGGGATCPGGSASSITGGLEFLCAAEGCGFYARSLARLGAALSPTPGSGGGISTCGGRLPTTPLLRLGRPLEGASWEGREPEPGVKTLH